MRVASLLLLFALSVTITVASSQAPVGVATLLAPNWKNPGAYLTDFAFIGTACDSPSTIIKRISFFQIPYLPSDLL